MKPILKRVVHYCSEELAGERDGANSEAMNTYRELKCLDTTFRAAYKNITLFAGSCMFFSQIMTSYILIRSKGMPHYLIYILVLNSLTLKAVNVWCRSAALLGPASNKLKSSLLATKSSILKRSARACRTITAELGFGIKAERNVALIYCFKLSDYLIQALLLL